MKIMTWRYDWSSQFCTQLKQLWNWSLKKIQTCTGFEPMTSAIPVKCCTNWAIKPTGSWPRCEFVIYPWKVKYDYWKWRTYIITFRSMNFTTNCFFVRWIAYMIRLKCYYDQILDTHFFLHFRTQQVFLKYLAKFQSTTNSITHVFWTFISENLRPPLIFLVPSLGWELEKMTSFSQKYHTGWNYNNN